MGGDRLIEFEESNFDWLVNKFIETNQDQWDSFVYKEYEKRMADIADIDEMEDISGRD